MTYTLGTHFEELLKNIKPPQERLDAARDLPPLVRDFLADHKAFKTKYPHTRLVGSYAQDMSDLSVKDVDFLVRVPGDPEANDPEAKKLIQDLRAALDGLPSALGYEGWAGVDIDRARRSVHVYIQGRDFHLDVVPCIAPGGFDDPVYVPDRGLNEWIPSHPVGFVQLLQDLTKEYGDKVRNLGKMLKHFRNHHMVTRRPKSYWLGAMLVYHVQNTLDMSQAPAYLVHDLFDQVYKRFQPVLNLGNEATPNIPDPLLGHNISWNWERSHFETFMRRIDDGRTWACKALDAGDRETAIANWQKVFGVEYFPSEVASAAKSVAAAAWPGSSFVSSVGRITESRPATGPYVQSQPTRFHGPKR